MIPILYENTETSFTSNGLGRLRDCITCEVTEGRNDVYEAVFTYPVNGYHYDLIQPGRIIGVTHDDGGDIQPFDIIGYSRPINGVVTFRAVHISYRLTGYVAWSRNINDLTAALAWLNIGTAPFSFSADFTASGYMAAADGVPRTVRQILGGVEGSLLDTYGGEYLFDTWSVQLKRQRGTDTSVIIRYGVNLADYNDDTDYTGSYTSVIPYWTGIDGANTTIVRGSRVDSGYTSYNGRRVTVPLDLTERFENKPTAAQLESMASTVMKSQRPYLPAQTVSVDFVRLQDTPEYESLTGLYTCRLCDTVSVVFPAYNMTGRFKIVKTIWDVLAERYTGMELGTLSTSLAEALGISQAATFKETDGPADPADYVTEQGKKGNFYYTKWNSGKVDAIGYVTFASLTFTASNNHYRSVSNAFTLPAGIFAAAPQEGRAWIQGSNTVYISATVGGMTTTGGNCEVWKSTSGNATNVSVHMQLTYTP